MEKTLTQIEKYLLGIVLAVVPLIILPGFPNAIATPKLLALALGVIILVILYVIRIVSSRKLVFISGTFDLGVLVLIMASVVSAVLKTPNRFEAFFLPGNASIVIAVGLLYYFLNQLNPRDKKEISWWALTSGVAVAIYSLFSILGVFTKMTFLPAIFKLQGLTTLEGNLPALLFLALLFPLGAGLVVAQKDVAQKILLVTSSVILALGIMVNLYHILPGKPNFPKTQGTATAWSVAVDTLQVSPFFGIGPSNYLTAFNNFRPMSFNQKDVWGLRFTAANNYFLTALTETGILGLAGLVLLVVAFIKLVISQSRENKTVGWGYGVSPEAISLGLGFAILLIFEANISFLAIFFFLLALTAKTTKLSFNLKTEGTEGAKPGLASYLPAVLIAVPVLAVTAYLSFFLVRFSLAETVYAQALQAVAGNNGKQAYDLMARAITISPKVDRYHASFAQLNFALANSIAQKPKGEKISEEERTSISTLISQSIAEAKAAVSLNPQRAGNWTLLASVYQSVMSFAQGADAFAIQTYNQAIALDPFDPILRISLGQTLFALGKYDDALDAFKGAAMAKPDLANAHYNLAATYRQKGEIEKAISEMTNVMSLIDRNSKDYEVAKKELEDLEAKRPAKTAKEGETLTAPQPAEEPVVKPPLELPAEAQPPQAPKEVVPSPTPTIEP